MVTITKGLDGQQRLEARWLPLLILNSGILAAAALYLVYTPKLYESSFAVKVASSQPKVAIENLGSSTIASDETLSPAANQLDLTQLNREILLSNRVIQDIAQQLNLRAPQVIGMLQVRAAPRAGLLQVNLQAGSPAEAKRYGQIVLNSYLARVNGLRQDQLGQRKTVFKKALDNANQELTTTALQLAQVRAATGLLNDTAFSEEATRLIFKLQEERVQAQSQLQGLTAQTKSLAGRLASSPDQAVQTLRLSSYTPYRMAREDLDKVERQLAQYRAKFTDTNPKVASLLAQQQELQSLVNQRQQEILPGSRVKVGSSAPSSLDIGLDPGRTTLLGQLITTNAQAQGLQSQVSSLDSQMAQINQKIRSLPAAQQRVIQARNRFAIAEGVFNNALAQYQGARLAEMSAPPEVQIFDPPSYSEVPSSPKPLVVLAGALAVAALGSVALWSWQKRTTGGLSITGNP